MANRDMSEEGSHADVWWLSTLYFKFQKSKRNDKKITGFGPSSSVSVRTAYIVGTYILSFPSQIFDSTV